MTDGAVYGIDKLSKLLVPAEHLGAHFTIWIAKREDTPPAVHGAFVRSARSRSFADECGEELMAQANCVGCGKVLHGHGGRGSVSQDQAQQIASAYYDRLTGS